MSNVYPKNSYYFNSYGTKKKMNEQHAWYYLDHIKDIDGG